MTVAHPPEPWPGGEQAGGCVVVGEGGDCVVEVSGGAVVGGGDVGGADVPGEDVGGEVAAVVVDVAQRGWAEPHGGTVAVCGVTTVVEASSAVLVAPAVAVLLAAAGCGGGAPGDVGAPATRGAAGIESAPSPDRRVAVCR
jgi:hypothetical protein